MKCYQCALEGYQTDAVAICIVCGMAVCMDHLIREELPVSETFMTGLGIQKKTYPLTMPRFLCYPCYDALSQQEGSR
ncbi:MAG: DUF2180 family protein [Armatimonadetes bacterium]|nr:DUF2180 family protein [Armatimonadota bacterium]